MSLEILGIGIAGKTLSDLERRILEETPPYAIVLFGRNIHDPKQLVDLVNEAKSIARRPPIFMIDEEGGRVDRLRSLIPGLPSVQAFAEGEQPVEMSEWFGKIIGMALRYFGIESNLAPVVDIRGDQAPKGLERRTFGSDPEAVVELAGAFIRGQASAGVAACLKHYPGIGIGSADPHYGQTVIDLSLDQLLRHDLVPFTRLGNEAGAIMIGHGTYPQIDGPDVPATLSYRLTTELLRGPVGFRGVAVSDDMEMHAVSDMGSYEDVSERAMMAGNDVILYCSHIERVPDLDRHLRRRVEHDPAVRDRFEQALERAEAYREHCQRIIEAATPRVASFGVLIDEAERFIEEFERTRPHREIFVPDSERRKGSRSPGKGRTGREEWT
ncbi:MAG: beta-N-acetylhexosaminidase [Thermoanaerobaculia bacterium]